MYTWVGSQALEKINGLNGVKKITIATAFFSEYGLKLLTDVIHKHAIPPQNVTIYLSIEFSDRDPAGLLERLCKIASTYIVTSTKLHAKVLLFEGKDNLMLTGSSNLTKGGFVDNLEFNTISEKPDIERLTTFFERCKGVAKPVNPEITAIYHETDAERTAARKASNTLRDKLQASITKDYFTENTYPNLDEQFFQFRDYETLFDKNQKRTDPDIAARRLAIRKKLLEIDASVQASMTKLGLAHHWWPDNITSTIEPNDFNQHRVAWCGIRYTRSDSVKYIRELKLNEDGYGFQKFACIQFCIVPNACEINLFHAVKNEAVDRDSFRTRLNSDRQLAERVTREIDKLKGHSLYWHAGEGEFQIDNAEPDDFTQWYLKNDASGYETFLALYLDPDDPVLKNASTISKAFVEYTELLLPLYKLMAHQWGTMV